MTPQIISATYEGDYKVRVRFEDGLEGAMDLTDELWGEVFEPLKDKALFRQFRLDEELNTLTWPTGADLAPEFLYARVSSSKGDARPSNPSNS